MRRSATPLYLSDTSARSAARNDARFSLDFPSVAHDVLHLLTGQGTRVPGANAEPCFAGLAVPTLPTFGQGAGRHSKRTATRPRIRRIVSTENVGAWTLALLAGWAPQRLQSRISARASQWNLTGRFVPSPRLVSFKGVDGKLGESRETAWGDQDDCWVRPATCLRLRGMGNRSCKARDALDGRACPVGRPCL